MVIRYFTLFFCIFLKHRRVELSFQCRNEFCMPKYPNNRIFMGFGEKISFSLNFCPYYSIRSGGYGPKNWSIPFWLNLTSFHLQTMIPLFLCNSTSNFQRKSHKKENNNRIFCFIFLKFPKNRRVELNFQCRNEFCMPKYPNNHIFMGFGEKSVFP